MVRQRELQVRSGKTVFLFQCTETFKTGIWLPTNGLILETEIRFRATTNSADHQNSLRNYHRKLKTQLPDLKQCATIKRLNPWRTLGLSCVFQNTFDKSFTVILK